MIELARHFRETDGDYRRRLRAHQARVQKQMDEQQRLDLAGEADGEFLAMAQVAVEATIDEISEFSTRLDQFETRLDQYDAAIIRALQRNERQQMLIDQKLREVREDLRRMLNKAHILEDGRRAFLTQDRTRAFDEFGTELSKEDHDFSLFPTDSNIAEDFLKRRKFNEELLQQKEDLRTEREGIYAFQKKSDRARDRVGEIRKETNDGMARHDLDDLEAEFEALETDLQTALPSSVRNELSNAARPNAAQSAKSDFDRAAEFKSATSRSAQATITADQTLSR